MAPGADGGVVDLSAAGDDDFPQFLGPERNGMLDQLGVRMTDRGNVWRDEHWMTSVPGIFTAGDMQRGQSLIVWAIAEGRSAGRTGGPAGAMTPMSARSVAIRTTSSTTC